MAHFPKNDIMSLVGEIPRYDLGESVGPDLRLRDLLDSADDPDAVDARLGYGTAAGDPRLRAVIAEAHGVSADDVVVTVGCMHALFLTAFVLCDGGDEAVTTTPVFPLARNALTAVGARVREVPLTFDRGYRLDAAAVIGELSTRTKLVSLASPQNPSGVAVDRNALTDILAAMETRCPDAFLLVDENYRDAAYGDDAVAPSAATLSERVVVCASLSKCHGAPGLRVGWAITRDRALREQLVVGKFNTVVSCSPLDEALALRVLGRRERILAERRRHLAEGLARTADWVRKHDDLVEWVRPDAGALCCVRLKRQAFDDAAVARFHTELASHGLRVANGTWFGDEARVFRLGFGLLALADLDTALARLTTTLRAACA